MKTKNKKNKNKKNEQKNPGLDNLIWGSSNIMETYRDADTRAMVERSVSTRLHHAFKTQTLQKKKKKKRSEIYLRGKSVRSWCDGSSDRSFMVDPLVFSRSNQCPTTGVTKAVECAIMSVEWCI